LAVFAGASELAAALFLLAAFFRAARGFLTAPSAAAFNEASDVEDSALAFGFRGALGFLGAAISGAGVEPFVEPFADAFTGLAAVVDTELLPPFPRFVGADV